MQKENIRQLFAKHFDGDPLFVRSPGRVNLIGEHTDYNDGFVLPAAIDKNILFAVSLRNDQRCRLYSVDFNDFFEMEIASLSRVEKDWANYLVGVAAQFQNAGYTVPGFNCLFGGDIPIGAGLSSSAALECGLAFALNHLLDLGIEKMKLIRLAQKAEHEFAGVQCGIMDQFANMFGREGYVVRLDCRSMDYRYFPFDMRDYQIVLCDTRVSHSLAGSEYNTRRSECASGVSLLQKHNPNINSLRDVTLEQLEAHRDEMPETVYKRCKYVVEEIRRVELACRDLEKGNLVAFGQKMYETHRGLRHDYEVSCAELDFLVDQAVADESVVGARMMGGGFGGCTINLVKADVVSVFSGRISALYREQFEQSPGIYVTQISAGTGLM
jgi:galactokinase